MRLWACPNACGAPAQRAPERARKDDWRTYCAACTERTGRLVRRVPPAVERKRAERKSTLAERAKAVREEGAKAAEALNLRYATSVKAGEKFAHEVRYRSSPGVVSRAYPPAYAQAAQTFVSAIVYYKALPDFAREAIVAGLRNAAPSWFTERIIAIMNSWPRPEATITVGPFAWSYLAKEMHRRGAAFTEQVRARMLEQLRSGHDPTACEFADEIECAPTAFRGH